MNQAWEDGLRRRRRTVRRWGCAWSFMSLSSPAVESEGLLYCQKIFFVPQMLIQQQKPLSRASPHHGTGEEKEQKSREVMLVTSNHHSMADHSCKAGRAMASFDSVSAEGSVIHL